MELGKHPGKTAQSADASSPEPEQQQPGVTEFGVIDLGSNTARLSIYSAAPMGPPWIIFESKETPRLTSAALPDGRLPVEALHSVLETLLRFQKILDDRSIRQRCAVATSALREAPNGPAFVNEVHRRTGLSLRVLSGDEEAQYGYLGAASGLSLADDILVDLGGGSLQLMRIREGKLATKFSLPLGALRMRDRFLHHDPPKRKEIEDLWDYVLATLRTSGFTRISPASVRFVGMGGTFRCLGRVLQEMHEYPFSRVHGYTLLRDELDDLLPVFSELSVETLQEFPGVGTDRADIILSGLNVVLCLLEWLDKDKVTVTGCSIREGVAAELMARPIPLSRVELALSSARSAAWAFNLSASHGRRVRDVAIRLFDLLENQIGGGLEERLALDVASILHDAGTAVGYPNHERHSSYMIRNHPLYGLTHREILLASLSAALHEGDGLAAGVIKRYRPILLEEDSRIVRRLGSVLALAEALAEGQHRPLFSLLHGELVVRIHRGIAPSPRAFEHARRSFRRSFGMEVKLSAVG
jgi:exopolyphosphatase/guanosine-5'-triphosphate,3'-diphosphate pyrophosphatase